MEIDIQKFKGLLEAELVILRTEMEKVARINPDSSTEDWEAKGSDLNVLQSDQNERAEEQESYEQNSMLLKDLEVRYNNVKEALGRIEDGTYGISKISGEPIELDRLEANPAATTTKAEIEQE